MFVSAYRKAAEFPEESCMLKPSSPPYRCEAGHLCRVLPTSNPPEVTKCPAPDCGREAKRIPESEVDRPLYTGTTVNGGGL